MSLRILGALFLSLAIQTVALVSNAETTWVTLGHCDVIDSTDEEIRENGKTVEFRVFSTNFEEDTVREFGLEPLYLFVSDAEGVDLNAISGFKRYVHFDRVTNTSKRLDIKNTESYHKANLAFEKKKDTGYYRQKGSKICDWGQDCGIHSKRMQVTFSNCDVDFDRISNMLSFSR